jgi:aquaporin NIP
MPRRLFAEFFATFVLVFGGTGVVVVNAITGGGGGLVGVALVWGLLVAVLAYSVGPVSGAHMNPAITVGLAAAKQFPWREVPWYIGAQCAGAFAASGLLAALTARVPSAGLAPTQVYAPDGAPWVLECFVLEVWGTAVLAFVVLALSRAKSEVRALGGLLVGGVVTLVVLFLGPISGASINPARSLAPAVLGGTTEHLWLYLTAPPLGALAGALAWKLLYPSEENT